MKILIAEDNPSLQIIDRELMDEWGFHCDIVSDGNEAINSVRNNNGKYDLCLMDIEMPVMNGIMATKIIRQKYKYFPIVMFSGNPDLRDDGFYAGADDFIEKPCYPDNLFKKINEITVKIIQISLENDILKIKKELPMNSEQLKELIDLDKKGLAMLIIEGGQQKFIVHKNIQNKMSHILIGEGKELFEFLDRGESPANCHVYKCNMQTNRLLLTPEQFEERLAKENSDIEKYTSPILLTFRQKKEIN